MDFGNLQTAKKHRSLIKYYLWISPNPRWPWNVFDLLCSHRSYGKTKYICRDMYKVSLANGWMVVLFDGWWYDRHDTGLNLAMPSDTVLVFGHEPKELRRCEQIECEWLGVIKAVCVWVLYFGISTCFNWNPMRLFVMDDDICFTENIGAHTALCGFVITFPALPCRSNADFDSNSDWHMKSQLLWNHTHLCESAIVVCWCHIVFKVPVGRETL